MADAVRVVIADDDELMRAGLKALLSSDPEIELVGEAGDGRGAIEQVRALRPDVVLMDVRMPDLDGITATRELTASTPQTKVLMLTTFEQDDYIFGGLAAGAAGFLLKRTTPEELIGAIHTIAAGDSLLSPSVTRRVIAEMAHAPRRNKRTRLDVLTPREHEVLVLIGKGLSNGEIAAELVVEESTVKSHVKRIMQKLQLRDRVQAVILAYENGPVSGRLGVLPTDVVNAADRWLSSD
jgi:DNA-binding NarL/FixJ family response regulator